MNWLSETPRTLICALAEWYGKRISRLFCIRRFLQRATRVSRLLRIPISQFISTPRSGMWSASGLTLAQQGEGRTAQGALRPKEDAYDRSSLAAAQGLAFQRIVELERQIDASRDRFC